MFASARKKDMVCFFSDFFLNAKCEMPKNTIEPHLVLKHISYINAPKNPIFKLVRHVDTRDFTVS